jgi:hypothetical protein
VRFDELSLRIPGDELRISFHDRFTVVGGLGALERQALVDGLLGMFVGRQRQSTVLRWIDGTGRKIEATQDRRGEVIQRYEDGSAAPDPTALLGLDAEALMGLCVLAPRDVGLLANGSEGDVAGAEARELAEARLALDRIADELAQAMRANETAARLGAEVAELDEALREAEEGRARRRYARLLADLERVRAEAVALRGGASGVEADQRLIDGEREIQRLSARWHQSHRRLEEAKARFGDRTRLDPRAFEEARTVPERMPAELSDLADQLTEAQAYRDAVAARLQALVAARLPEPSDGSVITLASLDQARLWTAARNVLETGIRLEEASLEMGGLGAAGMESRRAEDLERAHEHVEAAQATARNRRVVATAGMATSTLGLGAAFLTSPLMIPGAVALGIVSSLWGFAAPRRALLRARQAEKPLLQEAGLNSYLAFQLRRIDATIDPAVRTRLSAIALEHRVARTEWHEIVGDIDAADALLLEDETRSYASALANLDDAADEIDALRNELTMTADPALARARTALLDACAPYGVDDPSLAVALVRHQVDQGRTARLQADVETAEQEEAALRKELDAQLGGLGVTGTDLSSRLGALDRSLAAAHERERARASTRDPDEVDADLARLEAEARREYRPEWGATVTPADAPEPDIEALRQQRDATAKMWNDARRVLPDVELVADRRDAVERRVTVLEAALGDSPAAASLVAPEEIERYLQARLASLCSAGPQRDPLPLVLDEPFLRIRGDRKGELLDFLARLSERTQIVYLCDDPDVVVWARTHAAAGSVTLLEPASAVA